MIYDDAKENNMSWDHNQEELLQEELLQEELLALSKQFAGGGAYWYGSVEYNENALEDCCKPVRLIL